MKYTRSLLGLATLCTLQLTTPAWSQSPAPGQKSPPQAGGKEGYWKGHEKKILEAIPEDLRERFKTARTAALEDPKIQELKNEADKASEAFRSAVRESMVKSDPDLTDAVNKISEAFKKNRNDMKPEKGGKEAKRKDGDSPAEKLPPEEKSKLDAARAIAKQAPSVQAAEAKLKAATTPESREIAAKEFRQAMHDAILTADPSLASVLESLGTPKPPRQNPPPAPAQPELEAQPAQ
jgi:hypothetical protein